MSRSGRLAISLLAALAIPGAPRAWKTTASDDLLNMSVSARQAGMGGIGEDPEADVLAASANPASLLASPAGGQAAVSVVRTSPTGQTLNGLAAGWSLRNRFALGVFGQGLVSAVDEVDALGGATGASFSRRFLSGGVSAAAGFDGVGIGATAKMVTSRVIVDAPARLALDLGGQGTWRDVTAGAAARNLGRQLPEEVRVGAAYAPVPRRLVVGAQYVVPVGWTGRLGCGAEIWPVSAVGLRVGLADVTAASASRRFTAGLSAAARGFAVDYAVESSALGLIHSATLSWALAPPTPRPPWPALPVAAVRRDEAPVPPVVAAVHRNLAVADLTAQGVSASDGAVMSDLLRGELVNTGEFTVLERNNMERVLAEQRLQATGCTAEDCAVKMGKILNVHLMVVGSLGRVLDTYVVSLRVVEVETARIVHADSANGADVSELTTAMRGLARRMAERLSLHPGMSLPLPDASPSR